MARDEVLVERSGPVTTVIINRPEARNACLVSTVKALHDAFMAVSYTHLTLPTNREV